MHTILQSDAHLVRRARRGHPRAVEELVVRYQKKAYAVARAIALGASDPEDIVQEATLRSLQSLGDLKSEALYGAWYLTIVRNVARSERRRQRPSSLTSPDNIPAADSSAPDPGETRELRERLWTEVSKLPEQLREAVFLYYYEGESVRQVAKAQRITTSAAKKRLQKGRELLRGGLWPALESYLRDMLPSAREWKNKGRQIALLALSVLPASSTLDAASGPAASVATETASGSSPFVAGTTTGASLFVSYGSLQSAILGGVIMAKKTVLISACVACLSVGAGYWLGTETGPSAETVRGDSTVSPGAPGPDEYASLERRYAETLTRLDRLEAENRSLREAIASAKNGTHEAETGDKPKENVEAGLEEEWSRLAGLLAKNFDLFRQLRALQENKLEPSEKERARYMAVMMEIVGIGSKVRSKNPFPIFDEELLGKLATALFEDPLQLSAEQMSEVQKGLPSLGEIDVETLTPAERYELRQDIIADLSSSVDAVVEGEQLEKWQVMQDMLPWMLAGQAAEIEYGLEVENLETRVLDDWKEILQVDEMQTDSLSLLVSDYVDAARAVVEQFGEDEGDIKNLPKAERRRLDSLLLEAQKRFERRILPLLRQEQSEAFLQRSPTAVRFRHGSSVRRRGATVGVF